jgi:hypothetical protein
MSTIMEPLRIEVPYGVVCPQRRAATISPIRATSKDFVTEKVEQAGFETLPRRSVPLSVGGPAVRPTIMYPEGSLIQWPTLRSVLVAE